MNDPPQVLAEAVTTFCEQRFAEVGGIAALAAGPLSAGTPAARRPRDREHCLGLLATTDPPLAGAGVVVAPYVLKDDPYWLEWWLAGPDDAPGGRTPAHRRPEPGLGHLPRLHLARLVRGAAAHRRARHHRAVRRLPVHRPVHADLHRSPDAGDRFLGVAGVDVLARWFEQHLFTVVDAVGAWTTGASWSTAPVGSSPAPGAPGSPAT